MNEFYTLFVYGFASLFSIMNPIGISAVFLQLTKNFTQKQRHKAAYLVSIYGCMLLITTFFAGPFVLSFFGISIASVQIAGGVLVFHTAWNILNNKPKINSQEEKEEIAQPMDKIFFPLTMPITAGAGALAVTIALAARLNKQYDYDVMGVLGCMAAIIVACATVAICYRFADSIFNKLGRTGTRVVGSLTAFILLAISVTVIWQGVLGLITPLL